MELLVYINFQEGLGFEDITRFVRDTSFSITQRAFNDTYKYAQNECSLELIYDATLWGRIQAATNPVLIRILENHGAPNFLTEGGDKFLLENGDFVTTEVDEIDAYFYGHLSTESSYDYNGITDNSILALTATDELDLLDIPCGDILYANHAVLDPANPTNSLVHKLVGIAGWSAARVSPAITIPTVIQRFATESEDSTILDTLNTLLFEYGYTLNMDAGGVLTPVKWMYDSSETPTIVFDDTNIIDKVTVNEDIYGYDGVETTYYELKLAEKVLLYRDDNCGYEDDGTFEGYNIIAGYTYPPETNVIDETTGAPTVVYQEYDETGIKYRTNKAIEQNLDYYYKAFKSNFTAIVATENQFVDARYSAGITRPIVEFYNKKCRLVYYNPTADSGLKLYYNNVYGDIWYKSTERKAIVDIATSPKDKFEYTMEFVYDKTNADRFTTAMAAQYSVKKTRYRFTASSCVPMGTLVQLTLGNGINVPCLIMSCEYTESDQLFRYILVRVNTTALDLTAQETRVATTIDNAYRYAEASEARTEAVVISSTPRYLGRFPGSHPLAYNNGDWWVVYDTDDDPLVRGFWYSDNGTPVQVSTLTNPNEQQKYRSAGLEDVLWAANNGYALSGGTYDPETVYGISVMSLMAANVAFIENLFAQTIQLQTGGSLRGGTRYDETGAIINPSANGIYIGADGQIKASGLSFEGYGGGGVQWTSAFIKGSYSIGSPGAGSVAALSGTDFSYFDADNEYLMRWHWSGTAFSVVGTNLLIPSGGLTSQVAISPTRIALTHYNSISEQRLYCYEWSGSTWAQVGNGLYLPGGRAYLAHRSATDVAGVRGTYLYMYHFDGADWTTIGTPLQMLYTSGIPIVGSGITCIGEGLYAVSGSESISPYTNILAVYSFDGTSWTRVGDFTTVPGAKSITALNGTDIVVFIADTITSGRLSVYRWDMTSFSKYSADMDIGMTSSRYPALCTINGTDIIEFDDLSSTVKYIQYAFCLAQPYQKTLLG